MLKKYVRRVLLPLLFSFCCVFSGFLNVSASASTIVIDETQAYSLTELAHFQFLRGDYYDNNGRITGAGSIIWESDATGDSEEVYYLKNGTDFINCSFISYNPKVTTSYMVLNDLYDYYIYGGCIGNIRSPYGFFNPDSLIVTYSSNGIVYPYDLGELSVLPCSNSVGSGVVFFSKINLTDNIGINSIILHNSDSQLYVGLQMKMWFNILPVPKDASEEQVNSIITAINNQTGSLGGKLDGIDSSVDDVHQSIEDQYSGEPEEEFNIDDVMTEHTEKMGVLSFGSDVMVQFLDMFQTANAGTAELTLPGFNITVQNVEYQVWPDYSFDFNQIDTWVPGLMSIVRVILPAFVWLKVLGYCITVFEKNFLSNNGG